jgi:hypothetical protein
MTKMLQKRMYWIEYCCVCILTLLQYITELVFLIWKFYTDSSITVMCSSTEIELYRLRTQSLKLITLPYCLNK